MHSSSIIIMLVGLFVSQLSFAAACPASTTSGIGAGSSCTVTGSASVIQLNLNSGFTDATGIAAVGGNNGTTIGAQRTLSFIKAAEILADRVASSQTIIVDAAFSILSCSAGSATLGSAGAKTNVANVNPMPGAAVANTFYPIGLINAMGNTDYQGALSDINSQFNSNIGNVGCLQGSNGWYYGYDAPPANYIGFTTVLLHEMTHGLGFASLVDASTGAKASGLDDIFSNQLFSKLNSGLWSNAGGLSNAQRAASAISTTGLLWNGANVNAQAVGLLTAGFDDADVSSSFTSGDRVQMYAPNPVEGGSSVSHFNTAASPNELMEPQYTAGQLDLGLALYLLKDIGWTVTPAVVANNAPTITAVDQSTNEDIAKVVNVSGWGFDGDGDSLTYSVTACPANISCSVSGSNVTLTPALNHNGATHNVTVKVVDGNGGTASDSFNLNVIAQNDAPVLSGIPNQTVKVGEFKDITLSGYATDVENDGLTFSANACGANLTCTFPNATTVRVTANGGAGTSASVTVEANDGNSGTNSDTFDVSITSAIPSTTIDVAGSAHNNGATIELPLATSQINVNNGTGNYTYSLDYNSSDVSSLVTANADGLTLGLPASGEFAGEYTLTITDNGDGDVITITVKRPLRLNWSAKAYLNGDTSQTLKVEGGAANTVYTLVQSGSSDLVFRDSNNNSVTSATAVNDAANFNAAVIKLDSLTVSDISAIDVTVQSSYDDVTESAVKVYPSTLHSFKVKNSADTVLVNATGTLNGGELLLTELNVDTSYSASAAGEFTILLPDTSALSAGTGFVLTVAASGYNSESLVLNSDSAAHTVTLTEIANGITLTGDISVQGSQNLLQDRPVVTVRYEDGSSETLAVTVSSVSSASFSHEIDLNLKSFNLLTVTQADSVTIELNLTNVTQSQNLNVILLNNVSVVVIPSSGGGSMLWLSLLMLGGLVLRFLFRIRR